MRVSAILRPIGLYLDNFLSVLYFNHSAHCWANKGPNGSSWSNICVCLLISFRFGYIPSISGQGGSIETNLNLLKLQGTIKMTFLPFSSVLSHSVPVRSTLSGKGFVTALLSLPVLGCQGSTLPKLVAFVLNQPNSFICHCWVAG